MELDHEDASGVAARLNEVNAYAPQKRSCCACFCRYWPMGVAVTPFLIILYFGFVIEEGVSRITWLLWLHIYTACVWFFTNSTLDGINQYLCPASQRAKARNFFLVKALVSILMGLVMFGAASMALLGGEDSGTWYEQHRQLLQEQVPNVHALGDPAPPAYIVTSGENGYREDLVESLRTHGVSGDNIHFVPAVMANTCKIVGEAGRAEMHRSFIFGVVGFVRNILMGDLCYDSCMFRCFGERFCPIESSPDKYQTIACQAPPVTPYGDAGNKDGASAGTVQHSSSEAAAPSNKRAALGRTGSSASDSGIPASRLARAARRLAEVDDDKGKDREDASGVQAPRGWGTKSAQATAASTKSGGRFDASQRRILRSPAASADSNGPDDAEPVGRGADPNGQDDAQPVGRDADSHGPDGAEPVGRDADSNGPGDTEPVGRDADSNGPGDAERVGRDADSKPSRGNVGNMAPGSSARVETEADRRVLGVTSPKVTNSMGMDVIDAAEAGNSAFDVRVNASNTFLHRSDAIRELAVAASHLKVRTVGAAGLKHRSALLHVGFLIVFCEMIVIN